MALAPVSSRGATSPLTLISDSGELTGAAASVDIQSIAQTYVDLVLVAVIRSTRAAQTLDTINVRFNNDSGANYYQQVVNGFGSTVSTTEVLTNTQWGAINCPAASSPAGLVSIVTVSVGGYASSVVVKVAEADVFTPTALTTGTLFKQASGVVWNSTAAITRVTVSCANGNLAIGSRVRLFGSL